MTLPVVPHPGHCVDQPARCQKGCLAKNPKCPGGNRQNGGSRRMKHNAIGRQQGGEKQEPGYDQRKKEGPGWVGPCSPGSAEAIRKEEKPDPRQAEQAGDSSENPTEC